MKEIIIALALAAALFIRGCIIESEGQNDD